MARREIGTRWDRENRNNINENFKELYNVQNRAIEEATQAVIDSAKLIWLEPVDTFADIATTYPSPEVGHTVFVRDTGKVYRFYDGAWMEIQQIDAGPVNEVDTRLSAEIEENRQNIEDVDNKILILSNDEVYVENYPKQTGEQADSDRIQRAINASVGKKLKFKKTTYILDKTVIIPSNIEIDFNGCTFLRKAGTTPFDMLVNSDTVNGNINIVLKNLLIDGNKDVDSLEASTVSHRFSGLKLVKVTNSKLGNITVTRTVNAEDQGDVEANRPAAGIYFVNCTDIDCENINGYNNNKTAIFVNKSRVRINGSLTYNNLGSGISSIGADESEYHNITSYNNGYSNISVNGLRSKVSNVLTYGSGYSGLNIGHNGVPADDTIVFNVHAYNNVYEGLTIAGSARVQVTGIEVYGNQRNNIRIFDGATNSKLVNVISKNSAGGQGILYDSGKGHKLISADIYKNAVSGVYVNIGVTVDMLDVNSYNNGQITSSNSGGIILNTSNNCVLFNVKAWDDQTTKTQENGLWIASGDGHKIIYCQFTNNKTYDVRKTTSPTNITEINIPSQITSVSSGLNGWTLTNVKYWRDENGVVSLNGRCDGGTVGTAAFNLPVGFRPSQTIRYSTVANGAFAYADITTNGDVILYISNSAHYIDGISFKV